VGGRKEREEGTKADIFGARKIAFPPWKKRAITGQQEAKPINQDIQIEYI